MSEESKTCPFTPTQTYCNREGCMAWEPEQMKYSTPGADALIYRHGYCKLIDLRGKLPEGER
jgi:hypothetical protein